MMRRTKQRFALRNRYGLKIRGALWNYRGQKSVVLCVHGFGGFMGEPQYQALRAALVRTGHAVCIFDQTNSLGRSQKDPDTMSYDSYFADVMRVVTWLRDTHAIAQVHLVAHSLGGGMSLQMMGEGIAGVSFRSATLINPLIRSEGTMIAQGHPHNWKQAGQVTLKRLFKRLTITREAMESMESFDVSAYAPSITTPLFFILGAYDSTIPPYQSRAFAQRVTSPVRVIEYPFLGHTFFHANALRNLDVVVYDIMEWIQTYDV